MRLGDLLCMRKPARAVSQDRSVLGCARLNPRTVPAAGVPAPADALGPDYDSPRLTSYLHFLEGAALVQEPDRAGVIERCSNEAPESAAING